MRILFPLVFIGTLVTLAATPASATSASDGLVCRTTPSADGTYELLLEWKGSLAKGLLRQIAPSGNTTTVNVHAERRDGMIVADDVHEKDVVLHAAVVREQGGKKYMRAGESRSWLRCE